MDYVVLYIHIPVKSQSKQVCSIDENKKIRISSLKNTTIYTIQQILNTAQNS